MGLTEWLIVVAWAASLLVVSWWSKASAHPPGPCLHQALAHAELERQVQITAYTARELAAARARITHSTDQERAARAQRDALLADLRTLAAQADTPPGVDGRLLHDLIDLIDRHTNPKDIL